MCLNQKFGNKKSNYKINHCNFVYRYPHLINTIINIKMCFVNFFKNRYVYKIFYTPYIFI